MSERTNGRFRVIDGGRKNWPEQSDRTADIRKDIERQDLLKPNEKLSLAQKMQLERQDRIRRSIAKFDGTFLSDAEVDFIDALIPRLAKNDPSAYLALKNTFPNLSEFFDSTEREVARINQEEPPSNLE